MVVNFSLSHLNNMFFHTICIAALSAIAAATYPLELLYQYVANLVYSVHYSSLLLTTNALSDTHPHSQYIQGFRPRTETHQLTLSQVY